jgi:hypothetical protein
MRYPARTIPLIFLVTALALSGAFSLFAQSSNQLWFVTYNGVPTPSSDVSVQNIITSGSATPWAAGAASNFVTQANFPSFNSPYDVAVDPAMGKAYVLDNNLNVQVEPPGYIYSFNLIGTPAQIAASAQVIYTMPIPAADVTANLYPLLSGLALDSSNHFLYFNQLDLTTGTNSYVGRLDLASSAASDIHSSVSGNPAIHEYYIGQIPGQGALALDATNLYLGAINGRTGKAGVYAAPRGGSGAFSEIVTNSVSDTTFTNGFVGGVASDPQDHLIYYLTFNAGYLNGNFNTGQNALWAYDTVARTKTKISAGYSGYPDNIAVDSANGRYYFTLGRDGTGNPTPTNYQAVYTGSLGSTNTPTLLYTPALSGQDGAGQINAGNVVLQGIFVVDAPVVTSLSSAVYLVGGGAVTLAPSLVTGDPSSTLLAGATVAIVSGSFTGAGDTLAAVTNGTAITAAYNASTETLTLSGSDSLTNYQQVLRMVAFSATNSDPSHGGLSPARTIAWAATDGVLSGVAVTNTLTILTATAPAANKLAVKVVSNAWMLFYTGTSGQSYVFQFANSLTGPWKDLSPDLTANSAGLVEYNDQSYPLSQARFYRVRTGP